MKIKIFTGKNIADVEKKVNCFISNKHVVGIKQSICSGKYKGCESSNKCIIVVITVMYHDFYHNKYCDASFWQFDSTF